MVATGLLKIRWINLPGNRDEDDQGDPHIALEVGRFSPLFQSCGVHDKLFDWFHYTERSV